MMMMVMMNLQLSIAFSSFPPTIKVMLRNTSIHKKVLPSLNHVGPSV